MSAKVRNYIEILGKTKLKYILPALAVLMLSQFVFGFAPTLRLLPETPDTDTVSIRQDTTPQ